MSRFLLSILTVPALVVGLQAATRPLQSPKLLIVSPAQGSYLSGPTTLKAQIEPDVAGSSVTFFADGRQVCRLTHTPFECPWDAGAAVVEHQIRVVAVLGDGTRVVQTVRTKGVTYSESVTVDAVPVAVTVTDGHGRFVENLPPSDFHVYEDGVEQRITSFAPGDAALDLLVAIDISGSMAPAMPMLKVSVKAFLDAVPSKDSVTLLAFNNRVFSLARRETDPAARSAGLDGLNAFGTTSLYDVIIQGLETLQSKPGRKALVVFTDGEDEGSQATIADAERQLQESDATLYMIGLGRGSQIDVLKRVMERLTTPTGGDVVFTAKIDQLHDAFSRLLAELSHQYVVSYAPPRATPDGAWHEIRVQVNGQEHVRARRGYRFAKGG